LSTVLRGQYASYSGTSMATPHVAGLAALILDYAPTMTHMQVKTAVLDSGDQIAALQGKTITGARINAYNALQMASRFTVFRLRGESSRTIPAGATEELEIEVGGPNVREGEYGAQLTVTSEHWRIAATSFSLDVFGFPNFHLNNSFVNFGQVALETSIEKAIVVQNRGNGAGSLTALTVDQVDGWVWELADSSSLPHRLLAGEEVAVLLRGRPSQLGESAVASVTLFTDIENQTTLVAEVAGEGVRPAHIMVTPPSLDLIGSVEDEVLEGSFVLSNTGDLAANYTANLEGAEYLMAHNQGEDNVPYEWIEVSETGQRITALNNVDDGSARVPLPFAFSFLERSFDSVFVSTNGFITFEQAGAANYRPAIPSGSAPNFVIAPYWADLRLRNGAGSGIYTQEVDINGSRAFVIEWENNTFYSNGNARLTFEVLLFEDGKVRMMMKDVLASYTGGLAVGYDGDAELVGENIAGQLRNIGSNISVQIARTMRIVGNLTGLLHPGESTTLSAQAFPPAFLEPVVTGQIQLHGFDSNYVPLPVQSLQVTADVRNISRTTTTTTTTTTTINSCPWTDGDSGEDMILECMDGTRCVAFREVGDSDGWACCAEHGGRARCPRVLPFMCAESNSCADGTAHCCARHAADCDAQGGLRGCEADGSQAKGSGRRLRGMPAFFQ